MTANAIPTQGTVLAVEDSGAPGTYLPIAEVQNFREEGGDRPETNVSSFESTAQENVPALPDFGSWTFDVFYQPGDAEHAQILADFAALAGVIRSYRLSFPSPATETWTVDGRINQKALNAQRDDVHVLTSSIRLTGAVVVA